MDDAGGTRQAVSIKYCFQVWWWCWGQTNWHTFLTGIFTISLEQAVVPSFFNLPLLYQSLRNPPSQVLMTMPSGTNSHDEVFQGAGKGPHHLYIAPCIQPFSVSYRPNYRGPHFFCSSSEPGTSEGQRYSCTNAICWFLAQHLNTIVLNKLNPLGIRTPMCKWLLYFLTNTPQSESVGSGITSLISLSLHWLNSGLYPEPTAVYSADSWLLRCRWHNSGGSHKERQGHVL